MWEIELSCQLSFNTVFLQYGSLARTRELHEDVMTCWTGRALSGKQRRDEVSKVFFVRLCTTNTVALEIFLF